MLKIFVYGTLKRGYCNHKYLKSSQFIGKAHIKGYDLYDLIDYPAIVKCADDQRVVYGEVYQICEQMLHQIDQLEDEGDLYNRVQTIAYLDGQDILVSTYQFAQDISAYQKIGESWPQGVLPD